MKESVNQTWSVKRIVDEVTPITWENLFAESKHELQHISNILDEQERINGPYYPLKQDIFAAFHHTPLHTVKVVLIGQDPYPQGIQNGNTIVPRATGLSFSVRKQDSIPSSLQNIYTELANSVRGFTKPDHGELLEWAHQGVLLLNTCLTLRPGTPGSHGDLWKGFIVRVFREIAKVNPNCIYLLWGKHAQDLRPLIGERSIVFETSHPSGLSARRGFFGCNFANKTNETLLQQGKVGITWSISTTEQLNRARMPKTHTKLKITPVNEMILRGLYTNPNEQNNVVNVVAPKIPVINYGTETNSNDQKEVKIDDMKLNANLIHVLQANTPLMEIPIIVNSVEYSQ